MKVFKYIAFIICLFPFLAFGAATDHYVDLTFGGAGNAGTFADPFNTMTKVNAHSYDDGDDLYFKQSTTHPMTARLTIDWEGVDAANPAVIGCYEGDEDFDCSGTRPILDGQTTIPVTGNDRGLIDKQSNLPTKTEYVTVENLKIYRSGDFGIMLKNVDNATVQNCYVSYTYKIGIYVVGDDALIDGNIMTQNHQRNYTIGGFGGVIVLTGQMTERSGGTVSGNTLFNNWGTESIGINKKINGATIEKNVVYDNWDNVAIYLDSNKNCIVRYNLLYNSGTAVAGGFRISSGVLIDNESYGGVCWTGGHKIYSNLIAYNKYGIRIASQYSEDCFQSDHLIYNNTIIDSTDYNINIASASANGPGGVGGSGNEIKNNISWLPDGGNHTNSCSASGYTWDTNLWNGGTLPTGALTCETNEVNGSPLLAYGAVGWNNLSTGLVTGTEFALLPGSAGIDAGVDLISYDNMINPNTVDFTASPINVDLIDGSLYGAAHDLGAEVYALYITDFTPADDATGQSITVDGNWTNPTGTTSTTVYFDKVSEHDPATTVLHTGSTVATHDFETLEYDTESLGGLT